MGNYELCDKVAKIPGWLEQATARRTMDLLAWQEEQDIMGGVLEIGVFCGRYLALALDSALRRGDKALGVDTFEFTTRGRVYTELARALGRDDLHEHLTLWSQPSSTLKERRVLNAIGQPRFVSVDGAHDYESVLLDLLLTDALAAAGSLVAVDDVLNPLTLGVNQAMNAFLSQPRKLVPVAYIGNKMFMAHRARAPLYKEAFERSFSAAEDKAGERFRAQAGKGRHHVEQPFHGHPVLIS